MQAVGFPSQITKTKLIELLARKYPNHEWDKLALLRGRYAQQKRFEKASATLFPVSIIQHYLGLF